jgi:hypothetical protein
MSRRGLYLLLATCAPLLWLLAHSTLDLSVGVLFLAPVILLAVPLVAGRYLGSERLARLVNRSRPRRRRALRALLAPRACRIVPPRGGLLIAASLAVRPPPLVLSP